MSRTQQVVDVWKEFGSMINTGLLVIAFLGLFFQGGGVLADLRSSDATMAASIARIERDGDRKWTDHEALHKSRLVEVQATNARFDERLKTLEETKIKRDGQIESLQGQVAALSEGLRQANAFNREVSSKLNDVVSDVKVVREILQRTEANLRRPP